MPSEVDQAQMLALVESSMAKKDNNNHNNSVNSNTLDLRDELLSGDFKFNFGWIQFLF